jgi:hypothetical protein
LIAPILETTDVMEAGITMLGKTLGTLMGEYHLRVLIHIKKKEGVAIDQRH